METIVSNAGVLITNYTRYASEDLLAMVNAVEAGLKESGCPDTGFQWSARPRIVFRKYGTKIMWRHRRVHDEVTGRYGQVRVRNYTSVGTIWNTIGGQIGLVPPGKIYEDPLSELAALSDDGLKRIPYLMLVDLWSCIVNMYPTSRETRNLNDSTAADTLSRMPPTNLQVRIESTCGEKRPIQDSKARSRELYKKKLRRARYYANRAREAAMRAERALTVARGHALRSGVEFNIHTERLVDTIPSLGDCCIDIILALKALSAG